MELSEKVKFLRRMLDQDAVQWIRWVSGGKM
jgi:hypothetical protein